MNNDTTMGAAAWPPSPSPLHSPAVGCTMVESPTYVVPYVSAQRFVYALALTGFGIVVGLSTVAGVLVVLVRRLNNAIALLRKESRGEVRAGLLNGSGSGSGAAGDAAHSQEGASKKKQADHGSGTSCAEEAESEED